MARSRLKKKERTAALVATEFLVVKVRKQLNFILIILNGRR